MPHNIASKLGGSQAMPLIPRTAHWQSPQPSGTVDRKNERGGSKHQGNQSGAAVSIEASCSTLTLKAKEAAVNPMVTLI